MGLPKFQAVIGTTEQKGRGYRRNLLYLINKAG